MAIDDIVETILLTASRDELLRTKNLVETRIKQIDEEEDEEEEIGVYEDIEEEFDEGLEE